jgi:Zn-dependent metalloprotease
MEDSIVDNGLRTFVFHSSVDDAATSLRTEVFAAAPRLGDNEPDLSMLDAENVAQRYVKTALASAEIPDFTVTEVNGQPSEFKSLGVENIHFTNTQTVKFRQYYRKIPVYGSLVTVELEKDNELVSINSALGDPVNIDPIASVSPAQALKIVGQAAGYGKQYLDAIPQLNYYYDSKTRRWRLVYIVENILKKGDSTSSLMGPSVPEIIDYVIDAHSGESIGELPRTQTIDVPFTETATDGLGKARQISGLQNQPGGLKRLLDRSSNVHTYTFEFHDIASNSGVNPLPGKYVENPPSPWDRSAIGAHANAEAVAQFIKNVLMRDGLDNRGGIITSSIDCIDGTDPDPAADPREWRNAAWLPDRKQMVYGQRLVAGNLVSYAVALDVVAHELLHGLTDSTARLVYEKESGALNESYSDIFGIIISNFNQSNINNWNWQMGEELSDTGIPLRDLSNPRKYGQPDHLRDYVRTRRDNGGVHTNSGIHNKAAFNILTAKNSIGKNLFDATSVARLFYLALTQDLSRTSGFSDSRRGVERWTRSLFRNDPTQNQKLQAIAKAFGDVGIN